MLSCTRTEELLSARMDGELAPADAPRVDAHLAACAACRALATELEGVDRFLLSEPALPDNPQFKARLRMALATKSEAAPAVPATWWMSRAVAVTCALGALFLYVQGPARKPEPVVVALAPAARPTVAPSIEPAARLVPVRSADVDRVAARLRTELDQLGQDLKKTEAALGTFKLAAAEESKEQHTRFMARSFETWK